MNVIVFIPGIMGSALETPAHEPVWPPTVAEVKVTGYQRTALLVRPDLVPTGVIRSVCIDFYGSLLKRLEAAAATLGGALIEHPYDWRRDLAILAEELDVRLGQLVAQHGPEIRITLVCHSMGGLIARACLERRPPAPWAGHVRLAAFLAVPHEGAPLAFARAIGVGGGSVGLSAAQQRQLSGLPGFPAAYQLFPPERLEPIWSLDSALPFGGVTAFDPDVAVQHGLNTDHLARARDFHRLLDPARRPDACRYFAVVSATHETVIRFDQSAGAISTVAVAGTGDGTVPVRSAAALPCQTAYVDADHVGVTQHDNTHDLLDMLLGVQPPDVVVAGIAGREAALALSLSARIIGSTESYEIVVLPHGSEAISGRIAITAPDAAGVFGELQSIPLNFTIPGATRLALAGPPLPPGQYRFQLQTNAGGASAAVELVVIRQNTDP